MSEMRDKQNNAAVPSNMQQDDTRIEVEADKPISTTRMQQLVDVQTHSTPHNGTCSIIADTKCLVKHFLTNILTFFKNTVQ
jgi:hypothetical protein